MMSIHQEGRGIAGVYTHDIAGTKADGVIRCACEFEMPRLATDEPDEES